MINQAGLSDNLRILGKALTDNLEEFWHYQIGNYQIIAEIHDQEICIPVIRIGYHKAIYR